MLTRAWRELRALGAEPPPGGVAARQAAWLKETLASAAGTEFGRRFGFASIRTPEEYRARVPPASYEDFAPDIARMAAGEADVLFAGRPVAFERTGGGALGGKLIPHSARSLEDFRRALLPWLSGAFETYGLGGGTAYFALSPAARETETTAAGIPIGLPDGAYLGADAGAALTAVSAVPARVGALTSIDEWRTQTLAALASAADLELISVWSPTFLLTLLDALPGDAAALWPRLKLVSAWADASSRPYWDELRARLPHAAFQAKGLLATEGVVTVPGRDGRTALAADSGFFEFLDDSGAARFAHELRQGARYEVATTTSGGLYRYRTGDRVVCEGFAGDAPVLRFAGRAGLTCDLVGEKLADDFVGACLADMSGFRLLVPVAAPRPGYVLVVDEGETRDAEAARARAEERLSANPQYAYARRLGQLAPLAVKPSRAPLARYLARAAAPGVRLGDVKVPSLRAETDWLATFEAAA